MPLLGSDNLYGILTGDTEESNKLLLQFFFSLLPAERIIQLSNQSLIYQQFLFILPKDIFQDFPEEGESISDALDGQRARMSIMIQIVTHIFLVDIGELSKFLFCNGIAYPYHLLQQVQDITFTLVFQVSHQMVENLHLMV